MDGEAVASQESEDGSPREPRSPDRLWWWLALAGVGILFLVAVAFAVLFFRARRRLKRLLR
jgi:hypothetical protein